METHPNVVVGVTILALLAMFMTFFTVGIIGIGVIDPPKSAVTLQGGLEIVTIDDYFSLARIAVGSVVGIMGSAAMWTIVSLMTDREP